MIKNKTNLYQIKKEGESFEMKCRLEEEMEEGECTMTWYLDDKVIVANDRSDIIKISIFEVYTFTSLFYSTK